MLFFSCKLLLFFRPYTKKLKRVAIVDLSMLKFVSDRGAYFVKALKNYSTCYCFIHRINNSLVVCFYQNESIKIQINSSDSTDVNMVRIRRVAVWGLVILKQEPLLKHQKYQSKMYLTVLEKY